MTFAPILAAAALLPLAGAGCESDTALEEWSATPEPTAGAATEPKVEPGIAADLRAGRAREVIVMLAEEQASIRRAAFHAVIPSDNYDSYLSAVNGGLDAVKDRVMASSGGAITPLQHYENLPLMHVRVDSLEALDALDANPEVVAVVEDRPMQAFGGVPANLSLIGQPTVAAAGKLGAGSTVAVLDTGTDYKRAPFNCTAPGRPASCPVAYAKDFAKADNALDTGSFHGTNVAGIVLAVAPSAKIVALDVFDGQYAWVSNILAAINWCVQNKAKYNIVAINMSLGGGLATSACTRDPFTPAVAAARAAGILSAIASGNSASSKSISSPACVPGAVAVGAIYAANVGPLFTSVCVDKTSAADQVACFSNSSSLLTVLAPGVGITAAGIAMSGTSQATPHVAGAIALIAAAQPSADPDAIVARLTTSSTMITDPRNGITRPRLDLPSALQSAPVSAPPAPTGKVVINGGAQYTKSTAVTVNVTTTSGTATQVCLSATPSCSNWRSYAKTVSWTLTTGDGAKPVYVWWKNAQGAASATPVSAAITLDTTPPTNGSLAGLLSKSVATLTWIGFRDTGSGLASYKLVSSTGSAPRSCSTGKQLYAGTASVFKTGVLPAGATYFRLCAADKVGNMSTGATTSVVVAAKK